jgi:hypothetical protein
VPIDARTAEPQDAAVQGDLVLIPAMFEHAQKVWIAMLEHAGPDEEYAGKLVYEGHLTNLFKKLRLSVPYYTAIKNQLTAMGCIEQVRRGGGNGTSKWVMWKEPNLGEWKNTAPSKARTGNKISIQEQRIKDLAARVLRLENIVDALMETK